MSAALITQFYTCFQQKDFRGMQACYHPESEFSDAMFPFLEGKQVNAMWHMLTIAGSDLQIIFSHVNANEKEGSCQWEAFYTFSLTGRKVHNKIEATFLFKDGKIIQHTDEFSFWRWSRMALGITGALLGWLPAFRSKVQASIKQRLNKFIENNPEYQ